MNSTRNFKICAIFVSAIWCNVGANTQSTSPVSEFANKQVLKFSTQGHSKSKDVVFSIKYPKSWAAMEGERPNIVQKFVSENGNGFDMALIITKRIPSNVKLTKDAIKEYLSVSEQRQSLPEGANFISAKSTLIEAEPAGIIEFTKQQKRADNDVYIHVVALSFIQGRTIAQIQFQSLGMYSDSANVERRFAAIRPLYGLMMNSIIIDEKWK